MILWCGEGVGSNPGGCCLTNQFITLTLARSLRCCWTLSYRLHFLCNNCTVRARQRVDCRCCGRSVRGGQRLQLLPVMHGAIRPYVFLMPHTRVHILTPSGDYYFASWSYPPTGSHQRTTFATYRYQESLVTLCHADYQLGSAWTSSPKKPSPPSSLYKIGPWYFAGERNRSQTRPTSTTLPAVQAA
jgi:hypothetical protein